jgi:hypothetical protein
MNAHISGSNIRLPKTGLQTGYSPAKAVKSRNLQQGKIAGQTGCLPFIDKYFRKNKSILRSVSSIIDLKYTQKLSG